MPIQNKYHDSVRRALIKVGWDITGEEVLLRIGKRRFWADIRTAKKMTSWSCGNRQMDTATDLPLPRPPCLPIA
ncbi:MAG: element excision factor XisH family protein [Aggregatilineales bacterium]